MKNIFLDTNVLIDLFAQREPFFEPMLKVLSLAESGEIKVNVSAISFVNMHYVLVKIENEKVVREKLSKLSSLVTVLPIDEKIISLSLASNFDDFEDATQYYSALVSKSDVIVTRNKKDFKNSMIPVFRAEEYIGMLKI